MVWRRKIDISEVLKEEECIKNSTMPVAKSTKISKDDIVVVTKSRETTLPLYAMATKARPPLPGRHAGSMPPPSGDVPPPLPPSRRPVPPPPQEEEPPLPSRHPPTLPPVPKGRQPIQQELEAEDESSDNVLEAEDESSDNVPEDTYDDFDIEQTNGTATPPLPSPPPQADEQEYDDWEKADTPGDIYEETDDVPEEKPALPSRNAPPPAPQSEELYEEPDQGNTHQEDNEMVYEETDNIEDQDEYEIPNEKDSKPVQPALPSRQNHRAPLPLPPAAKEDKNRKSSAPGLSIDKGALGSALKGLKRVMGPKEEKKNEEKTEEVPVGKLNIKEAITKFEQGEKPVKLPKPKAINHSSSSASSNSENSQPSLPARPTEKKPITKDLPLPETPTEESSDVFDEIYDECASNVLLACPWYHGDLNRTEAEQKLKVMKENGTFLVRNSSKFPDQPYTLVLLYNNVVKNLKVRKRKDGKFALGEEKADELAFVDVIELIEHHKKNDVILIKENAKVKLQKTPPKS